jgi:hypothetical protein
MNGMECNELKILVVHDSNGNIDQIGVPEKGPGGEQMQMRPPAGLHVTEVDADHITDPNDYEQLRNLTTKFRLDTTSKQLVAVERA